MDDKALNIISAQYGKEKRYWRNIFSETTGFCNFSHIESHKTKENNFKEISFKITEDIYNKIMKVTSGSDNRLLIFLITEVVVLLRKYSQLNDITIGTTILNQEKEGDFINTILPIKNELNGNNTLKELLIKNQFLLKNAIEHANYPVVNLVRELKIDNNDSNFPLFDVVVFLKNIQSENFLKNINNNFTFFFERHENYIDCNIKYNRSIQTEEDIQQIFKHFVRLLNLTLKDPNKNIDKIDILSETEKHQLLHEFNNTNADYSKDKAIHKLFEKQVEKTPNNIALVFENEEMSFQELNVRSNQLAHLLRAKGVKPDTIVGIMVERSFEMIIGIMGILKAGGAYLPIDQAYPEDRIRYILNDSKTEILLTQESFFKIVEDCKNIFLINLNDKNLYQGNKSNIEITNSFSDLIYVIYTSGSTGKPKGTLITHNGVVNYLCWASKIYIKGEKVDFPLYSSLSFDLTVTSLFLPLITGNKVIIYKEKENELLIENVFKDNKVDVVKLTPAHLEFLKENNVDDSRIKRFIVGGEELNTDLAKEIHNKYKGNIEIYNEYGPTETVVGCTMYKYNFEKDNNLTVPIGRPADNVQIYILNKHNMILPVCIAGELCVGGAGLARGYLGNQILTQEKFIDHPYKEGGKLYRTGDLARWLPDGNIEFLGRIDHQVKIRGFRIELGEIESVLKKYESIKECTVIVIEKNNEMCLCAYIVGKEKINNNELRAYVSAQLPEYMIPSYFVELESLPLTINGKVNRKALPSPEIKAGDDYVAPRNEMEEKLTEIWSDVLSIPKEELSVRADFFTLGGHSILAIKLISQIQNILNEYIGLPHFFKDPTIEGLSIIIQQGIKTEEKLPELIIDKENRYELFPLTDVQQAYWIGRKDIFAYGNVGTLAYTEFHLLDLDISRFNKVLQFLIERHEMLRMVITKDGEQRILKNVPLYEAHVLDLRLKSEEEAERLFYKQRDELSHQVFTGEEWPLFDIRITIFKDNTYKIHYSMDALIMDAQSNKIFYKEFIKLYWEPELELTPLSISFRDYVLTELRLRKTKLFSKSKQYWLNRIKDIPLFPDLPLLNNINNKPRFERHSSSLEHKQWNKLQDQAKILGITPTVFLIGCFAEVLKYWSKSSHFTLNLTLFNRIPFHKEVDQIIGDFTSLTLLEINSLESKEFSDRLKDIQSRMWNDLEHKYFSGVEVLREMSRHHNRMIIMPVVITSILGLWETDESTATAESKDERPITKESIKTDGKQKNYSISQTPQVWIDFKIIENNEGLIYQWDSIEGLFPNGVLDEMFDSFNQLLNLLLEDTNNWKMKKLISLPENQQKVRIETNLTSSTVSPKLLHELFKDQVLKRDSELAIISKRRDITYGELDNLSNLIGKKLRELGTVPNKLVGIVMHKCWEQVAGSIGVLASGSAFLPIDASLPEERIKLLLDQGEVDIVLTTPEVIENIKFPEDKQVLFVDENLLNEESCEALEYIQSTHDLAYVIFTSGSTGIPKGVVIDHQGAVNTILDINERFNITPEDRVLALSSLSFDLSVYDIFGLLGAGGTIVIPDMEEARDPESWLDYIHDNSITIWNSVPALMQMLIENAEKGKKGIESLRLVLMSGDWIPLELPARIRKLKNQIELISLGGATEASIWSIWYRIEEIDPEWGSIPYGKPLKNQRFYVLKSDLSQCPDHVPGDLYIGGIGLAQGYWKDKEKTNNSFIVHPETGERLYKTGDLGCYYPDGNIEFLGRMDDQVKIRGYRIELGEIEKELQNVEGINQAVVVSYKDSSGDQFLCSYVVTEHDINKSAIKNHLRKFLPEYMIPVSYVKIDNIPLNANGKLNKKALPQPEIGSNEKYIPPSNETEEVLVEIWSEILDVDKSNISVEDNFFELGGHSLKANTFILKLNHQLGVLLLLTDVFLYPTIKDIAALVRSVKSEVVHESADIENIEL